MIERITDQMRALARDRGEWDPTTIYDWVSYVETLERLGGGPQLAELLEAVRAWEYAERARRESMIRVMVGAEPEVPQSLSRASLVAGERLLQVAAGLR